VTSSTTDSACSPVVPVGRVSVRRRWKEQSSWSYDLLIEAEQSMLQTLPLFQGGFSVRDVAIVGQASEREARNLVDALTAKSLVDITRDALGQVRLRLLETIRLFALARLVDARGAEAARDPHLDHFSMHGTTLSVATWWENDQVIRVGREYESFPSAIIWALERNRTDDAVRLAAMGAVAACSRGEGQLAIDVLRQPADLDPLDRGFALAALGWTLVTLGDFEGAMASVQSSPRTTWVGITSVTS
jgi:predicted ATPase